MNTVFVRALKAEDKESVLRSATQLSPGRPTGDRFEAEVASFADVPGSPFAYWVSDSVRRRFKELPAFASDGREAWMGLSTGSDKQWLRLWWEVPASEHGRSREESWQRRWVPLSKGGDFATFYPPLHLLVNWSRDGGYISEWKSAELAMGRITANNSKCWNQTKYFRKGLTWSRRTQKGLSFRMLPAGTIFGDKGPGAFARGDSDLEISALAAVLNSEPFKLLVSLQMAFGSYEVGVIERTPVPSLSAADKLHLSSLATTAWSLKRSLETAAETSFAFALPALLQVDGGPVAARTDAWAERIRTVEADLDAIQAEIDELCFQLYGIDEANRAISEGLVRGGDGPDDEELANEADEADEEEAAQAVEVTGLVAELVSWAVGAALGRFDVRLATGQREVSAEPGPFDPLPVCSPGMLAGADGLPLAAPPPGYSLGFPTDGILVDDPGDARDLTAAVRAVFDVVFGASAEARWDEAAALLDPRGHDLRAWLRSGFSERHLKLYSKSRRKAPIMWQLGTPSGRYSVWLYAHRLTNDSFFQLQNDVLAPKLAYEERQLSNLVQSSGGSPTATDRREIEAQERFVEELRVMLEEVKRVAPLWRPTLDDGIVLVMAPLWRLVPHKPWQRELKKKWSELAAGKYDWAQLAMHLWPERVVPKCGDDRSLAIAHSLWEVLWIEDEDGKWHPRQEATTTVNDLIRDRTSAAVKDALGALA